MIISIHIGMHCCHESLLLQSLKKNRGLFERENVAFPAPWSYRSLLDNVVKRLEGAAAGDAAQDLVFDTLLQRDDVGRLILTDPNFACVPDYIFRSSMLYDRVGEKTAALRNLFPGHPVELFMSIRNPATFIPDAMKVNNKQRDYGTFMRNTDPASLLWSDVVTRIRGAVPDAPLTVWSDEDTPFVWGQVIREIAGLDPKTEVRGGFDVLEEVLLPEGLTRMQSYLKQHQPQNEMQLRRIIAAFLDKYVREEALETEIELPGWTVKLVEQMTERYEDDLFAIQRIPGVNFLAP